MTELYDSHTELAALRCAIVEPELFTNHFEAGDFGNEAYGAAWAAGRHLLTAGRPVTFDTLAEELERVGVESPVALVNQIYNDGYESPAYIDDYAATIKRWAQYRQAAALLGLLAIPGDGHQAPDVDKMLATLADGVTKLRGAQRTKAGAIKTDWTVAELLTTDFPEPRWAVPGLIPVGLSWLAGRPKVGKSWLALQIAHAVGSGGMALGQAVEPGRVLYLALEDSPRRLKSRLQKQSAPSYATIDFRTSWRVLTDGGLEDLRAAIDSEGYRLVVVDTFSRAAGRADQGDWADMSELTGELQSIALGGDMAVLVLDHHRKPAGFEGNPIDDIANSTAKAAVIDAALGLYKQQGKPGATLKVVGRDVEEAELVLSFDGVTGCWQLEGTAADVALRGNKTKVLDALRAAQGDLTLSELEKLTGITVNNLHPILAELVDLGAVERLAKRGREVPYQVRNI